MTAPDHRPSLVQRIKRWLAPLQGTPLHPQWLLRGGLKREDLTEIQGMTLDVGCAGSDIRDLLPRRAQYIGLDYYDTATCWYGTTPQVFGDGQSLPFADNSFQCVLMLHVLEHLRRPEEAIAEAQRILAPGGLLVVEVPFMYPLHDTPLDFHRWTEPGLDSDLKRFGFSDIATVSVGQPTGTAAVLFCLALSSLVLRWLRERSPWLLISPLLLLLVPLINLAGWALSRFELAPSFMPHRVRAFARKPPTEAAHV
jgi:SAM-dependent methyltransferase